MILLETRTYQESESTGMNLPDSPSSSEHRKKAAALGPVRVALITVSDTRTAETDVNAAFLGREVEAAGHRVTECRLIRDEPDQVESVLNTLLDGEAQVLLFNGGTGIAPRDTTYDVLSARLDRTLPGFGELFRMISFEQIGAAAMLTRATAGTLRGKVIISMPGSPRAVELAWEKLIEPELAHLVWEANRS